VIDRLAGWLEDRVTKFVPISRQRHGTLKWNRPTNYAFSSDRALVTIVGTELAPAATSMPLAFIRDARGIHLVALLSGPSVGNLFVGPSGQWAAGTYIPAQYRTYPFRLLRESGERIALCVDEESGLIPEDGGEERFFSDTGELAAAVSEILKVLETLERSRAATTSAVAALDAAGLVVPWEVQPVDGETKSAGGLYKIDEGRLRNLDDEAFLRLRKTGGLSIAHAQLISLSRLETLKILAEHRKKHAPVRENSTLASILAQGSEATLRFD
jgi:hypothetical protein